MNKQSFSRFVGMAVIGSVLAVSVMGANAYGATRSGTTSGSTPEMAEPAPSQDEVVTARRAAAGPAYQAPSQDKVMEVKGGATGDGPADQAECDRWAELVNDLDSAGWELLDHDMAGGLWTVANVAIDAAQDRGCFIIY